MRCLQTFSLIVLSFFSSFSFADIVVLSGSKTAYQYDAKQVISTPAPEGYHPFYIDHVGRHGSRYITKSKFQDIVYKTLLLAENNQQLTHDGTQLITQVMTIMRLNQNRYGQLTDLGVKDISLIGQRMLANNPTVFKGNTLEVISSSSQRAKHTAEVFIAPFKVKYPDITIKQQPENAQTLLRFFEYSPAYKHYKNDDKLKALIQSIQDTPKTEAISHSVAEKIFNPAFLAKLDNGIEHIAKSKIDTSDFVIALYALYQELLSFSPQMLADNYLDFSPFFSPSESEWLTTVITAKNYLQIGPAFDSNGIQIKIAAPLLWDMLNSADKAIDTNTIDANLRFAHAETVSPLATLLEIEGTSSISPTFFDYPRVWNAEKIIPMSANIQLIFYRSSLANQPILVKVLLNEREVHIPVQTDNYPYYRWNEVKRFYVNKLNKLGLPNDIDPLTLLTTLQ